MRGELSKDDNAATGLSSMSPKLVEDRRFGKRVLCMGKIIVCRKISTTENLEKTENMLDSFSRV